MWSCVLYYYRESTHGMGTHQTEYTAQIWKDRKVFFRERFGSYPYKDHWSHGDKWHDPGRHCRVKEDSIRHLRNKQSKRNLETNLVIRKELGRKPKVKS